MVDQGTQGLPISPVGCEISDVVFGNPVLDPGKEGILSDGVRTAEVGEVGHDREFVWVVISEVFWVDHLWDVEVFFGKCHSTCDVLEGILWAQRSPIGNESWFAVVNEGREVDTIVPVGGEVGNVGVGEGSLEPGEDDLTRGHFTRRGHSDLELENESPENAQNQLEIAIHNVMGTWRGRGERGGGGEEREIEMFLVRDRK